MKKRGQATIFVILAIIIVALAAFIYTVYPQIKNTTKFDAKNPSAFLQSCIGENLQNIIKNISLQGGSLHPEHYYLYNNEKIEYLCYTNEYYRTCVIQQPMLIQHIESEINESIKNRTKYCFNELESKYKKLGYGYKLRAGRMDTELLPEKIILKLNYPLTLTKGSDTTQYNQFNVILNNNLYELASIANSIIDWESKYGDAETTTYMNYYHNLKVEKLNQMDGSTIYILTNRDNGNKFEFASRSVAWPPGV